MEAGERDVELATKRRVSRNIMEGSRYVGDVFSAEVLDKSLVTNTDGDEGEVADRTQKVRKRRR